MDDIDSSNRTKLSQRESLVTIPQKGFIATWYAKEITIPTDFSFTYSYHVDRGNSTSSPFIFEYALNTTSFNDHAKRQRLIALLSGEQMISSGDGLPNLPDNTIISKTFYCNFDDIRP